MLLPRVTGARPPVSHNFTTIQPVEAPMNAPAMQSLRKWKSAPISPIKTTATMSAYRIRKRG
jgi:hypothetical protein